MSALDELRHTGWCCTALERSLSLSALRARFGPGWRFIATSTGEWWATAGTSRHHSDESYPAPVAIEANSPGELAAALSARSTA